MVRLISCGDVNANILYAIIGGIFKLSAEIILYKSKSELTKHPIILALTASFGMSLSIIPYFILIRLSRRTINQEIDQKRKKSRANISLIYNAPDDVLYEKIRLKKWIIIILSSLLDFIQKILSFVYAPQIKNNFWILNILFLSIFSYLILKTKLYIHQYISLIVIIVLGIILNIINLYDNKGNMIIWLPLIFFVEVIYSLVAVLNKYTMEFCYCTPYEVSFYQGIFGLIVNIALLIFYTNNDILENDYKFINKEKIKYNGKFYLDNFYDYCEKLNFLEIILFIINSLSRLFFNLFGLFIIKIYTTSHIIILLIIGEIYFIFEDDLKWQLFLNIFIILILLFMFLIFTEIIELNFWGMEVYTRKNIANRALLDKVNNIDDVKDSSDEDENNEHEEDNENELSTSSLKS